MDWKELYKSKLTSCEEAVKMVKSGDRLWISPCASAPIDLVNALCQRYEELKDVHVYSGLAMYPYDFMKPNYKGHIDYHVYFMGPVERKFMPMGNVEVTSVHFSQFDHYMLNEAKPNVCFLDVSEPDERGYMSYGAIGTGSNAIAVSHADRIVVQVNKYEPYVYGEKNIIHTSEVDCICEKDHPLPQLPDAPATELERKIASYMIPLIPDGATVQIGLGGIANAVGYALEDKKDLGIHTEMLTNSMVHLAKKGVINCRKKNHNPGKIVCGFGIGTTELYEFMHKNPLVHSAPIHEVNNIENIAKNDNFISINNALLVDLTGQVCSESLGFKQFSCTGGQLDFVKAAALSKGGKSFIALSSTVKTKNGGVESKISLTLPPGTAVSTPRADVMYVVTEYGIADIYQKSIDNRVKALIQIAHPDFREQLTTQAKEAGLLY